MSDTPIVPSETGTSEITTQTEQDEGDATTRFLIKLAPLMPEIIESFFKSKATYVNATEVTAKINAVVVIIVTLLICGTFAGVLLMLLYYLGPEEGSKFLTQISTLLGGLLGGLGIGLSLKSKK